MNPIALERRGHFPFCGLRKGEDNDFDVDGSIHVGKSLRARPATRGQEEADD